LLPAQTIFRKTLGVTVLRVESPSRAARGKKRPAATSAKVARLVVADFAPNSLKHYGLRLSARAQGPTFRAFALFHVGCLLSAIGQLIFAQLPGEFIADLAGQFFQVHERTRRRQFALILPRQLFHHRLNP
jgi:hypothetical protein